MVFARKVPMGPKEGWFCGGESLVAVLSGDSD